MSLTLITAHWLVKECLFFFFKKTYTEIFRCKQITYLTFTFKCFRKIYSMCVYIHIYTNKISQGICNNISTFEEII